MTIYPLSTATRIGLVEPYRTALVNPNGSAGASSVGSLGTLPGITTGTGIGTDSTGTTGSSRSFGQLITGAIDNLSRTQNQSDALARQAATGDLQNISDYMIAATDAQLTTQLTVAVRNKAVDAFQEIMRMQV